MIRVVILFFTIVCANIVVAQPTIKLFPVADNSQHAQSTSYYVDPVAVNTAYESPHIIVTDMAIPTASGTQLVTLDLQEFSVVGPETHFMMIRGNEVFEAPLPSVKTFRGTIAGEPTSKAYLAIKANGDITGVIGFNGEDFNISVPQSGQYHSIITSTTAIPYYNDRTQCVMTNSASYDMKVHQKNAAEHIPNSSMPQSTQAATKTAVVAFDVDNACYQDYGDGINSYLVTLMGAITTAYESEVDMAMQLGIVKVFTTADPYTGGDLNALLNSFTNYWAANNGSVSRTMAHLASRRLGGGGAAGLAWVDVMCDKGHGYGVSNISPAPGILAIDRTVTGHELGHNVGSFHTHDCAAYPPNGIDHCVNADGGCSWTPQQVTGTIMSYCNNRPYTFGARVQDTLKARIQVAPCLQSLAQIQLKFDSINFHDLMIFTKKDSLLTAIIKNPGSTPLKIFGITIEDDIDTNFSLKNLPKFPLTIAAGASQNITLSFTPKNSGAITATLKIFHNATGGSTAIPLVGNGVQPLASFGNTNIDFGNISDPAPRDSTFELVNNAGDAPLQVKRVYLAGPNASEFKITSSVVPFTLNPGQKQMISIRFTAASDGLKDAVIRVISNDLTQDSVEIGLGANVQGLGVHNSPLPNGVTLSISPNPTSGVVNINLDGLKAFSGKNIKASLYDKLGKEIASLYNGTVIATTIHYQWQLPKVLSAGSYTLVLDLGATRITRELIVQ